MQVVKTVRNNSGNLVVVTFYIAGFRGDEPETYGTRRMQLLPGQSREICYGDLEHSFLTGIKLEWQQNRIRVEHKAVLAGDSLDSDDFQELLDILNSPEILSIETMTLPHLQNC